MKKILDKQSHKKATGAIIKYDVYEDGELKITRDPGEVLWAERYRPRIIEDLILPSDIESFVEGCVEVQAIPNILMFSNYGGLGKDSIISVLINAIPNTLLTINASLHRDINTIRTTVMDFVSRKSLDGSRKVVYLNEVGGLTKIALDSLKSMIEEYSKNASFLMTTNNMANISHPLQSRFNFFELDMIPKEEKNEVLKKTYFRLKMILDIEGVEYQPEAIKAILAKNFPRHRDLLINIQQYSSSSKLTPKKDEQEIFPLILESITDNDLVTLLKVAETVDIHLFIVQLAREYKDKVENIEMIPDIIESLDELQVKVNARVPFPSISFLTFCVGMMRNDIKFKKN